ncbi:L-lactate MFS transporter [Thermostichus vulcanus]|uniref:OFA family MFS transporter n=1 Tax=Thermostichus vulcanus str. 'Rupite' TaxID=2813851 RepID=A0ABT0C849_THEVL|nr:OFA family MFS transporter [Thermostichus vulcanus]MCJ2541931.1 OFA family MFS transporter [Thermostichus vulcanus str. 'Rupite']
MFAKFISNSNDTSLLTATGASEADFTLFGQPARQGRWLFIPLGILVLLCLGTVYSWSIFRKPLEAELGIPTADSLLPYTFALVFYAALMPITGFVIPRWGSRRVLALGGSIVGLGYILASFANTIGWVTLSYGALAGAGVGIAYGVPMVVVARWLPDRKGLAVGLTIIGFGLSPLITAPLANYWIEALGVRSTLRLLGILFGVVIVALSTQLKLPPTDWIPVRAESIPAQISGHFSSHSSALFKTRSFYGLWICYAIGTLIGLSAIGISSPVGEELIGLDPTLAASSVALFAIFNGLSRPLFGWLADHFQPHQVATGSYGLVILACGLMMVSPQGSLVSYWVAFSLLWFCLGGWLAMAPTLTLRLFNPARYAQNYGVVFTAYGVGALTGTMITGQIRDWLGSYSYIFYGMAVLAILGILVANVFLREMMVEAK